MTEASAASDPTFHTLPASGPMAKDVVVFAVDVPADAGPRRGYFSCTGGELAGGAPPLRAWKPGEPLPRTGGWTWVYVCPTKTYSEGMGSCEPAALAPEDRAMIRAVRRATGAEPKVRAPGLKVGEGGQGPEGLGILSFDSRYLADAVAIFKSCMTRPNRQDYTWLATKTFGFNLVVRLFFVIKGVMGGQLPLLRAILSTSWYQIQDAVFTVFGQTYMKFLGKMTPMVRIHRAYVGDFVFVYFQLCGFEFLNRLLLGPLGENPLVYTWSGLLLIFANILQGMISGGPLIPAINQARKQGAISHPTMMHLYQVSSLTMQFGLFASFGYQKFYAILTGSVLVLAWGSYILFSTMFKDPEFLPAGDPAEAARLEKVTALAARA